MKTKLVLFLTVCLVFACLSTAIAKKKKKSKNKAKAEAGKTAELRPGTVLMLDNFDRLAKWSENGFDGTKFKATHEKGVLIFDYDLKDTQQWVVIEKTYPVTLPKNYDMKIKLKATGNVNNLEVKLTDKDGSNFGYKEALDVSGQWSELELTQDHFSYLWGGDKELDKIDKISFAISHVYGNEGKLYLDKMSITSAEEAKKKKDPGVLDDFETSAGWIPYNADGCIIKVKASNGKDDKCIVLDYDLGEDGGWVAINKNFELKIQESNLFKMWVKAPVGSHTLEFKIVDTDGSNFGLKFNNIGPNWKELVFETGELEYWWGGDSSMDAPKQITYAVSSEEGGKGKLYMDKLRLEK